MKTILLVEDTENDVFFFDRALKRKGIKHPVQVVEDGEAAVDYLSGKGVYADRQKYPFPSVIFLDINLPKRTGHEVLGWYRNEKTLPYIPVVMLSSSSQEQDM